MTLHAFAIFFGFTLFQCAWATWWAWLHQKIRRDRAYSSGSGRIAVGTDSIYRIASPLLFLMQNALCIASFWSVSPWLLKVHDSNTWRAVGALLFLAGSVLYWWALRHLGHNYSPCYDAHAPLELVRTGPYRWIRHPMYAAKLLIGIATFVISGSLWFVPTTIYFFAATLKATQQEDDNLVGLLLGYEEYRRKTSRLIPCGGGCFGTKN